MLKQSLQQKLSPQQIQFIKLLQVPTAELDARIEDELEINPDIFMGLESAVSAYSEPFGDSSLLPMDILSKMASPFKKVILTGDGGDEGFNAYSRYCFFNISEY